MRRKDLEPACFYLRKSREDQEAEARGEGETLTKHKKQLFKHAKSLGVNITKIYEEIVSGESIVCRPEMLTVLKEVEEGKWRSVWCMDIDRFGRGGMQDQGLILDTFKRSNTLIVTPRKIYDLNDEFDEEYSEFEAFMARKELKIINRRLQRGRRNSAEEGNYVGVRPPFGYDVQTDADGRVLVPHPKQAEVVKLIFNLYVNGMGSNKIAKELNRLGYSTYTGKAWESSTILFILKNEVYIGRIQWGKKEEKKVSATGKKEVRTRPRAEWVNVKGKHTPLVSGEVFEKVQEILKSKYHVPYQIINGQVNPLAGLIKCDMCGGSIVLRPYTKQRSHLICYNPQCSNKSTRFDYVERELIFGLENWLHCYKTQWEENVDFNRSNGELNIKKKSLDVLKKKLMELEDQKEYLHDLLEQKVYDYNTYLERSNKLEMRLNDTKKAFFEMESSIAIEMQREQARRDIIPQLEKILDIYNQVKDPSAKGKMLKAILEYATYRKEKWQQKDEFTLVLYPKLPRGREENDEKLKQIR